MTNCIFTLYHKSSHELGYRGGGTPNKNNWCWTGHCGVTFVNRRLILRSLTTLLSSKRLGLRSEKRRGLSPGPVRVSIHSGWLSCYGALHRGMRAVGEVKMAVSVRRRVEPAAGRPWMKFWTENPSSPLARAVTAVLLRLTVDCGTFTNSSGTTHNWGESLVCIPTRRRTVSVRHHRPRAVRQEKLIGGDAMGRGPGTLLGTSGNG